MENMATYLQSPIAVNYLGIMLDKRAESGKIAIQQETSLDEFLDMPHYSERNMLDTKMNNEGEDERSGKYIFYDNYMKLEIEEEYTAITENMLGVHTNIQNVTALTARNALWPQVNNSRNVSEDKMVGASDPVIVNNAACFQYRAKQSANSLQVGIRDIKVEKECFAPIKNEDDSSAKHISYDYLPTHPGTSTEIGIRALTETVDGLEGAICEKLDEVRREKNINQTIDRQFSCHLCSCSYGSRLPCLNHIAAKHQQEWIELKERNDLRDIGEFSERTDKVVESMHKRENQRYDKGLAGD